MRWELTAGNIRRSWTGAGSLEITGPDDHFDVRDYVIVFIYVVTVDLIAFFGGMGFIQRSAPVCGPTACFANPQATIHDALLYVWLSGVVAVLSIAITAAWKIGRAVVATLQTAVFVGVVIVAGAAVIRAHGQQQELRACGLGAQVACIGVDRVS